jgi:uncharacterized protein (TIGR02145 family)
MKKIILLCSICFFTCATQAQVTIGSGIPPEKGALLDLKENAPKPDNTTAAKGLLLPRVKLTEPDKLYPMFEGSPGSGTDNSNYDSPAEKDAENSMHTGLWVYNLSQCDGKFAQGVYSWTGAKWEQLTHNPVLTGGNPVLNFTPALPASNFIEIPSGQDLRTATAAYAPSIAYSEASSVTGAWNNTDGGGLLFTAHPLAPAFPATWTASPVNNISIWPDDMTAAEVAADPFLTRESELTITALTDASGPCPPGSDQRQVITLNQTNYAIVLSGEIASPTSLVLYKKNPNLITPSLPSMIESNAKWQATDGGGTVPISDILGSDTTTPAWWSEPSAGSSNMSFFQYTSTNPVVQGEKHETAKVTFSDVSGRAKPVTITFMQCQGTLNPNAPGVLDASQPAYQDSDSWGTSVVRHPAKSGVYEEFYSADFGAAGRWMTTNLAAWAYDNGVTGVTLPATPDVSRSETEPRWCYPSWEDDYLSDQYYIDDPHIGLLYNWTAATGKQNTSTANQGTIDSPTPGPNEVESLAPNGYWQGICPAGWHLPSDREWTDLENEIIRNTTKYSSESADIGIELTYASTNGRAETHGQAMTDFCEKMYSVSGHSRPGNRGGLALILAGTVNEAGNNGFRQVGIYMSSSYSRNILERAWSRYIHASDMGITRVQTGVIGLFSVRCLKN